MSGNNGTNLIQNLQINIGQLWLIVLYLMIQTSCKYIYVHDLDKIC
jgi:hypothetical protein